MDTVHVSIYLWKDILYNRGVQYLLFLKEKCTHVKKRTKTVMSIKSPFEQTFNSTHKQKRRKERLEKQSKNSNEI